MQLSHIPLERLHISPVNMRHGKRAPDISDILPSVRARGILQPLLVRPNADGYEIVAGRRRYFSAKAVKEEGGVVADIPCAIMEEGDDASAVEASLIENVARQNADPLTEYETFNRLIKEGRSVENIAATFAITPQVVRQRLALANLLHKIKDAYRADKIDDETFQHLTLATKGQQLDWWKMFVSDDENTPYGSDLKHWLCGGQSIATNVALFDLADYRGHTITDLFEEQSYFTDSDLFWQLQNAAIEAKAEAYRQAGWSDVIVLEVGENFAIYDHEKTPKKKGGKVYIAVSRRGEVTLHEGWLSRKAARKSAQDDNGGNAPKSAGAKPQMTQAMENYLELHRHGVVRLALLRDPAVAFRLMVAHAIAPTGNWHVLPDGLRARSKEIDASVRQSAAFIQFDAEYKAVIALLDVPKEADTVVIFARLLTMTDAEVMRVAAFAMALTLGVGEGTVEAAGLHLKADAMGIWNPDEAFFDLLRDRTVANAMRADIAGKAVAKSNAGEKLKTQKRILRDFLGGENGRAKVENWLPGWMRFPFVSYGKGASRLADAAKAATKALAAG
ncbi:MAG TPA: ParB/RepB/Spo0J family partition protein [Rhizomicrobium sp.]